MRTPQMVPDQQNGVVGWDGFEIRAFNIQSPPPFPALARKRNLKQYENTIVATVPSQEVFGGIIPYR